MPVAQLRDTYKKTRPAAATLGAYIRVSLDANGALVAAAATDKGAGFLTERGAVSGQTASYRGNNAPEHAGVASQAILVGAVVYGDAAGKVTDVDGGSYTVIGTALTAAAGDGSIITIEPA